MLERQSLLLRRCEEPSSEGGKHDEFRGRKMLILDLASGEALGSVYSLEEKPTWLKWLSTQSLTIFETEDLSHVFSLRRSWAFSPEWIVRDSECRHVGTVIETSGAIVDFKLLLSDARRNGIRTLRSPMIHDALGRTLASFQETEGKGGLMVAPGGSELAMLLQREGEMELTFEESATQSPFTRMLLLAVALIRR